jgi:Domain of unknown function (DUF4333)
MGALRAGSGEPVAAADRPPPARRGYWIPGLIALAALLAIGLAFGAGDLNHRSPSTLQGVQVAQQLALAIQAEDGTHAVPDITCPASEPVRAGVQFVCTMAGTGSPRPIEVSEIDGRGHLRWHVGS